MSKFYLKLSKKDYWLSTVIAVIVLLSLPAGTQAQGLEFKSGRRVSGNDGDDGAVYKFASVTKDVDGLPPAAKCGVQSFWFKSFNYTAPVQGSLPILLNSFTAKKNGSQVVLNWSTDMERDFSHFVVEKSGNGKDYTDAGVLFTDGNSSIRREYSFKDDLKNMATGLVYYRLKMVDLDGNYKLSDVRIIKLTEDNASQNITVYPNPVVNDLRITLASGWQNKVVQIQLLNANGQSLVQFDRSGSSQTESVNVNNLKPGLYIVRVSDGSELALQRFIKAK